MCTELEHCKAPYRRLPPSLPLVLSSQVALRVRLCAGEPRVRDAQPLRAVPERVREPRGRRRRRQADRLPGRCAPRSAFRVSII